jgi:hypothetical protein
MDPMPRHDSGPGASLLFCALRPGDLPQKRKTLTRAGVSQFEVGAGTCKDLKSLFQAGGLKV